MRDAVIFPRHVKLFDVDGIPVSLGRMPGLGTGSAAWDTDPPREFDASSARSNGKIITPAAFLNLVTSARQMKSAIINNEVTNEKFREWTAMAGKAFADSLNPSAHKDARPSEDPKS